jgi:hypothetical protein
MRPIARPQRGEDEQMPGPRDLPGIDGRPETPDSRAQPADTKSPLQHRGGRLPPGHPSSPYNTDGSRRTAAVSLKELEAAEETDTSESSPGADGGDLAGRPEHSGDRAEGANDGVSEGWRAALPQLQGLWERHKERWPAERRPPVDRSDDEEGSWRGDGPRQYLNAEENLVTKHALGRVHDAEREVTGTMKAVEADVPGARLVGLEHRLKDMERFKEKVSTELRAKPDRSIDQIGNNVPDAMRYTYQFSDERYTDGYWDVCRQLQQGGYEIEFSRNSWDGLQYKGINSRWRHPAGQLIEVQFHTEKSFSAKQLTHQAYERIRGSAPLDLERGELYDFQSEVTSHVPVPAGAQAIPDYRKKETQR